MCIALDTEQILRNTSIYSSSPRGAIRVLYELTNTLTEEGVGKPGHLDSETDSLTLRTWFSALTVIAVVPFRHVGVYYG